MTSKASSSTPNALPVGVTVGQQVEKEVKHKPIDLKLNSATRLIDLTDEYCFYTPAIIYLKVNLDIDLLSNFNSFNNSDTKEFSVKFDKPVFHGLQVRGDRTWDFVLFAMHKEIWPDFVSWLGTCAFYERGRNYLARVRTQELTVNDPLEIATSLYPNSVTTQLPVAVFCLDTNIGSYYMDTTSRPPQLVRNSLAVYEDTKQMAKSLKIGDSDPYRQVNIIGNYLNVY